MNMNKLKFLTCMRVAVFLCLCFSSAVVFAENYGDKNNGGKFLTTTVDIDKTKILEMVQQLLNGIKNDKTSDIDNSLCLDWFTHIQLEKAKKLNILNGIDEIDWVASYKNRYRSAVVDEFSELVESESMLIGMDMSQVKIYQESEISERVILEDFSESVFINGDGLIELLWANNIKRDIPLMKIQDQWCLNPTSI